MATRKDWNIASFGNVTPLDSQVLPFTTVPWSNFPYIGPTSLHRTHIISAPNITEDEIPPWAMNWGVAAVETFPNLLCYLIAWSIGKGEDKTAHLLVTRRILRLFGSMLCIAKSPLGLLGPLRPTLLSGYSRGGFPFAEIWRAELALRNFDSATGAEPRKTIF